MAGRVMRESKQAAESVLAGRRTPTEAAIKYGVSVASVYRELARRAKQQVRDAPDIA